MVAPAEAVVADVDDEGVVQLAQRLELVLERLYGVVDGEQGAQLLGLVNFTPWSASQATVLGSAHSVCSGWSSVTISRMFGRPAAAAGPAPATCARAGTAVAAATAA
ncbi:hypothetical protein, partial [Streptomyces sp. NRRL B-24572]|uniref:hypothetical protein n=1 Tax=Streptomyces sp. NRRL B-24572 TaxID=1962156 RepID=UPI0015C5129B